ncbi:hypothetical protein [Chenggangzhangella methanolivorans]|uniref:Uncharacterized protein n=1 Tax=Chenggangzhangella methanolivorans TaxID=1437009 RepID=A0A9E6UH16_9HYPH|nr:hypothetical protein [Chenggangzhangella methanolivorans]QZN99312.1 hypothetical protein K6K41_21370 [Chenggangzhangella methanolivorans]
MTDSNAFFRFIWRMNALVIFGLALLSLLAVVYWVVELVGPRARNVVEISSAGEKDAPAREPARELKVGGFQPSGPSVFEAPLLRASSSRKRPALSSGFKGGEDQIALNVVFFNTQTGEIKRVFPTDSGLVLRRHAVRFSEKDDPVAHLYVYVPADSNGDKLLTDDDAKRVVMVRPDGGSMITLAEGVDEFDRADETNYGSMLVKADAPKLRCFVRKYDETRFLEVDLATFTVTSGPVVALPKL